MLMMRQYFSPDYELDVRPSNMDNANTKEYLDKIRNQVVENLKRTAFAPSVQMADVPREPLMEGIDDDADAILDDLDEDENKDKRYTKRRFDQYVERDGELSDSEDEEENSANGIRRQPGAIKRRNRANYRHIDVVDSGLDSGIATPRDASSVPDEDMDLTADAKEDKADAAETEERRSPSAVEQSSKDEEEISGTHKEMGFEEQEQAVSSPISPQLSPIDTDMEDAGAPNIELEQTGTLASEMQEKTPPASPPEALPSAEAAFTDRSRSPATGPPQSTDANDNTTEPPQENVAQVDAGEHPEQSEHLADKEPEKSDV
jgi:histone deacetylase 1/2